MPPPNGTVADAKSFSGLSGPTAGARSQSRDQINNGNDRTPAQKVAAQDFTPQMPSNPLSLLMGGPFSPFINSAVDQTRYGMNDIAQARFDAAKSNRGWDALSPAQQVQYARQPQLDAQLSNAYIGGGQGRPNEAQLNAMRPEGISESQWAGLPMEMKSSLAQSSGMMGGLGGGGAGGNGMLQSTVGVDGGPMVPLGGTRDYSGSGGTFKPITFRSGTGTAILDGDGLSTSLSDAYSGLPALVGQGTGLMGQASTLAQQAPNEFNYNFDPQAAGQRLFNERSALLDPAFAQQRSKNLEQMQGLGRLGLQLSGEGLGAGENSGMMNPDMFGMNAAQAQALSQLSAQSTQDAFGQEMQRAGLDLNQFNTNQQQQQQQYANLMGSGQGMLSAGLQAPALEQSLTGIPFTQAGLNQQQQGLDQSYALGTEQNAISRMLADAKIAQGNVQDNGWLTGLTSLGSAYLGTSGGSGWLTDLFTGA
tara:strand:+ start:162 stop:1592 length:1431 start_codon:yes stop_codon:yes gene_type:complete